MRNVRFWHKADIARLSSNVRFLGVKRTLIDTINERVLCVDGENRATTVALGILLSPATTPARRLSRPISGGRRGVAESRVRAGSPSSRCRFSESKPFRPHVPQVCGHKSVAFPKSEMILAERDGARDAGLSICQIAVFGTCGPVRTADIKAPTKLATTHAA